VEAVGEGPETGAGEKGCGDILGGRELFSTRRVAVEMVAGEGIGRVFHFCPAPTVTTSFIAFVFDIRREQK
jgi:hypothetical protein